MLKRIMFLSLLVLLALPLAAQEAAPDNSSWVYSSYSENRLAF